MAVLGIHRPPVTVDYLRPGEELCFQCTLSECEDKSAACLWRLFAAQDARQAEVDAIATALVERSLARAVADCGPVSRVPAHRASYRVYAK